MTIGTTMLTAAALAAITLVVPAPALAHKNCRRLCRDAVRQCVTQAKQAESCGALHGSARQHCAHARRALLAACRSPKGHILQACAATPDASTCSPSGAFAD